MEIVVIFSIVLNMSFSAILASLRFSVVPEVIKRSGRPLHKKTIIFVQNGLHGAELWPKNKKVNDKKMTTISM